jgi:hypothetical protein
MINACFQPLHSLDSATQKSRSPRRNLGRATALLYTAAAPASNRPPATLESPYVMCARGLVQLVLSAMLDARRIKA